MENALNQRQIHLFGVFGFLGHIQWENIGFVIVLKHHSLSRFKGGIKDIFPLLFYFNWWDKNRKDDNDIFNGYNINVFIHYNVWCKMGNVKCIMHVFVLQKTTRKGGNTIWGLSLPGSDRISPSICVPPVGRTSYFWNPQNECLAEHQGPSNKLQCHAVH